MVKPKQNLDLQQPNASAWVQNYDYDMAYRMTNITSPAGTFAYTYNSGLGGTSAASSLITQITLPNAACRCQSLIIALCGRPAWISNTFDNNGRMLGTWLTNSSSNIDSSVYTYNVGNQRTTVNRTGENTASYGYDAIGEVITDDASEGTTNRLNEQLHYVFDAAGNLLYRTNSQLIGNFTVNTLNELTANTNGGKLTVMGTTTSKATNVTVNSTNTAQRYGDATFAATNFPFLSNYTAVASDSLGRHATNTVTVNIATNNTSYVYDGNGNLLYDGLRTFVYDCENQLIQVLVSNQWMSDFSYDGKMRRRIRQEYTWQNSQWVQTNAVYYVYDGNVVVQERNASNLPTTTYTRGLDLNSSLQDGGGIGGLLAMTLNTSPGPSSSNSYYYHCDDNGNVTLMINPSQYIVAKYLYDAFGNVLSSSGLLAQQNVYRFSSKEAHLNSGLVYYLLRYYDPNLQRWLTQDPIGENGGANLYRFVGNNTVNLFDPYGLSNSFDTETACLLVANAAVGFGIGFGVAAIAVGLAPLAAAATVYVVGDVVGGYVITVGAGLFAVGAAGLLGYNLYNGFQVGNKTGNWNPLAFTIGNAAGGFGFGGTFRTGTDAGMGFNPHHYPDRSVLYNVGTIFGTRPTYDGAIGVCAAIGTTGGHKAGELVEWKYSCGGH